MTHSPKTLTIVVVLLSGILLSACTLHRSRSGSEPPYSGPVAKPQVAYRIDEQRFFEIVPLREGACSSAIVYYTDKAKDIHTAVVRLDPGSMGGGDFIIDAANDQYLVAPIVRGNTDCESGGNGCSGSRLPYSTDGGRTWKGASPASYGGYKVYMSGDNVYTSGMRANMRDLSNGYSAWHDAMLRDFPKPMKAPIDTKFHCTPNGKE
jgi:hypothetical protein